MSHIHFYQLLLFLLLSSTVHSSPQRYQEKNQPLQSAVYRSPPFNLNPGSVANKFYFNIQFPRGHIALKSLDAEVVEENGTPVPLHETYLHHWIIERYYGRKVIKPDSKELDKSNFMWVRNSGICNGTLGQYFGLGSETRRTATWIPDPYGIQVGDPSRIPVGFEERWLLNVHAIDTRVVEDRLGCTECRCSLYNVTKDEFGHPLPKDYEGGLYCCYDQTQCRLEAGAQVVTKRLYLKYTVRWRNWSDNIIPVEIFIFDVTDSGEPFPVDPRDSNPSPLSCEVEYEIKACKESENGDCVDAKRTKVVIPKGGEMVYGVAHQHSAGLGAALYGQDGRLLCTSNPIYGQAKEAGDEAGYIVGMSSCYPSAGSVKIAGGEVLTLESNYSSKQAHTGVMGLFYILVAVPAAREKTSLFLGVPASWDLELPKRTWSFILAGCILSAIVGIGYLCKRRQHARYQALVMT